VTSLEIGTDVNGIGVLERKLRQLKAARIEIEDDIAAIERILGIMGE
jgi:hypothetical protein